MTKRFHKLSAGATAAVAVLALAACSSGSGGSSSSSGGTGTLLLGHLAELTGGGASTGIPEDNAVKMAVDQINAAGGFDVGGKKYKIQLDTQDDKSDPTAGVTAVQKIRTDGAKFMVGTIASTVLNAYLPIVKDDQNFITVIDGAAAVGVTDNVAVYRPRVTLTQYTQGTVAYIKQKSLKNVALLTDAQHAGMVAETPKLLDALKKINVNVPAQESYKLGDTDYSAQLTAILKTNPDAINVRGFAPDAARIIKQARELGYNGLIIDNAGVGKADVDKAQAASAMTNAVDVAAPYPADIEQSKTYGAAAKKFVADYTAKFNVPPAFLSASAYSAVNILITAMEKAGTTTDVAKVRAALDKLKPGDVKGLVDSVQPNSDGLIFTKHQANYQIATREYSSSDGDLHATGFVSGSLS